MPPPVAVSVVFLPRQIGTSALATAVGLALTVTITSSVCVQENPLVTVTVYVIVAAGVATGLAILVAERLVLGPHA